MRSKYNHSRQRKLPVKPIKQYKGGKDVERKIINTSGYTVGHRNNSHLDSYSNLAIYLGIAAILSIIVFIATLPVWIRA